MTPPTAASGETKRTTLPKPASRICGGGGRPWYPWYPCCRLPCSLLPLPLLLLLLFPLNCLLFVVVCCSVRCGNQGWEFRTTRDRTWWYPQTPPRPWTTGILEIFAQFLGLGDDITSASCCIFANRLFVDTRGEKHTNLKWATLGLHY